MYTKNQFFKMLSLVMTLFITTQSLRAQQTPVQINMPYVYMCAGGTTMLDAGTGTCATTYLWNQTGETTQTITVNQGGIFTVTITYPDGGICEKTFTVLNYPTNLADINVSGSLCAGNNITLSTAAGCNYVWSSNDYSIANPNGPNIIFTPNQSGTHTFSVTATNYYGCADTRTVSVNINPSPNVTITTDRPTFICAGSSITLTGNGANSYAWSNGANTDNITVAPTTNTTYTVTGTNANGCTNTAAVTVTTSTACVSIAANRCGNTIDNLLYDDNGTMMSTTLPNVSHYLFTFTPINDPTNSVTFDGGTNYSVPLLTNGSLTYNTEYLVTVQAQFTNGTFSPVSPACHYTIDSPETIIATSQTDYCHRSVGNLQGQQMFAFAVGNASNYQFTFTPISGVGTGTVCTGSSGPSRNISLTSLDHPLSYSTTYSVTVQVTAPGPQGVPVTGPISAPSCVYTVTAPQTTVHPNYCGTRTLGSSFAVLPVLYATSYVYTFTSLAGDQTVITSNSSSITLSSSVTTNTTSATYLSSGPQLSNNMTYNVTITVTAGGLTGPASSAPCQLTIGNPNGNRLVNPTINSVDEIMNNVELTVFPNPAKEKINITLGNVSDKKYTIEMYDMFGKLIYKNEVLNAKGSELNTEIDLTNLNLSKGIYLIYVNSDSQKTSQRVVIEK